MNKFCPDEICEVSINRSDGTPILVLKVPVDNVTLYENGLSINIDVDDDIREEIIESIYLA